VSFAALSFCVASQLAFVVVYFVIDSVRKLLDIPSYIPAHLTLIGDISVNRMHVNLSTRVFLLV